MIKISQKDEIAKQVFKQTGEMFSQFNSEKIVYLKLRPEENTNCILKNAGKTTPLNIYSDQIKEKGFANITFEISHITFFEDYTSFRFRLLQINKDVYKKPSSIQK